MSWTGLLGGLLGFAFLAQSALFNVVSADDPSVGAAVILSLMALAYLPAVWVSLLPSPNRQRVLRGVLVVTLLFVVLGVLFVSVAFATLLLVPSTLLAIAAGLVWQGPERRR